MTSHAPRYQTPLLRVVSLMVSLLAVLAIGTLTQHCLAKMQASDLLDAAPASPARLHRVVDSGVEKAAPVNAQGGSCADCDGANVVEDAIVPAVRDRLDDAEYVRVVLEEKVATDLPNIAWMLSHVPLQASMTEAEYIDSVVPHAVTSALEAHTVKLFTIAQALYYDPNLSEVDRARLTKRARLHIYTVSKVSEALCDELNSYVGKVATRILDDANNEAARTTQPSADLFEFGLDTDIQGLLQRSVLHRRRRMVLDELRQSVSIKLHSHNPEWRETMRVCWKVSRNFAHYHYIIDPLLNDNDAPSSTDDD